MDRRQGQRQLGKDGLEGSSALRAADRAADPDRRHVDLAFCALAMYLLLPPANPDLDFVTLSVVFILATLLTALPAALFQKRLGV